MTTLKELKEIKLEKIICLYRKFGFLNTDSVNELGCFMLQETANKTCTIKKHSYIWKVERVQAREG